MALDVEGVLDGGVNGQEPVALIRAIWTVASSARVDEPEDVNSRPDCFFAQTLLMATDNRSRVLAAP